MEETDSERNIRLGREVGATLVSASGTAVGMQSDQNERTRWKRDQIDEAVKNAIAHGISNPEQLKQVKLDKIEELRHL